MILNFLSNNGDLDKFSRPDVIFLYSYVSRSNPRLNKYECSGYYHNLDGLVIPHTLYFRRLSQFRRKLSQCPSSFFREFPFPRCLDGYNVALTTFFID